MLPGDYSIFPPLALSRSSKTLQRAQNAPGENILYLNGPPELAGGKRGGGERERGKHREMRDRQVGSLHSRNIVWCCVAKCRCFTFSLLFLFFFLQHWLWVQSMQSLGL